MKIRKEKKKRNKHLVELEPSTCCIMRICRCAVTAAKRFTQFLCHLTNTFMPDIAPCYQSKATFKNNGCY